MNGKSLDNYIITLKAIAEIIGVNISQLQLCKIKEFHDSGKIPELLIIDEFGNDFNPELDIDEIECIYEESTIFVDRFINMRRMLGEKLESARIKANLSIEDVSSQTIFTDSYIHDVENGYDNISDENVYLLCDIYDAEFSDIIINKVF